MKEIDTIYINRFIKDCERCHELISSEIDKSEIYKTTSTNNSDSIHTFIKILYRQFDPSVTIPKLSQYTTESVIEKLSHYCYSCDEHNSIGNNEMITLSAIGRVYESLHSTNNRRIKGIFYTPFSAIETMSRQALIEYLVNSLRLLKQSREYKTIVKLCGNRLSPDKNIVSSSFLSQKGKEIDELLKKILILDPSVGAGGFLIGMLQQLYIVRKRLRLRQFSTDLDIIPDTVLIKQIVGNNLFGVDIDPIALGITDFRLNLFYRQFSGKTNKCIISKNLWVMDTLLERNDNSPEKFDIVIGNPPYERIVPAYKTQLKSSEVGRSLLPLAVGGKVNLFQLFLAKSLESSKPGGIVHLLIPASFLGDKSNATLRKKILQTTRLVEVTLFEERDNGNTRLFSDAKMSTCTILLINNTNPSTFTMSKVNKQDNSISEPAVRITSSMISRIDPLYNTIPLFSNDDREFVNKVIRKSALRVGDIARCYEGEINLSFHKEYLHRDLKRNATLIKGAAVQQYFITERMSQGEIMYLNRDKYLCEHNNPKSKHHCFDRIVMQGITGVNESVRLKMTIIPAGIFCGNSTNYLLVKDKSISIYFLLGLLNSSLLNKYFKLFSTNSNVNTYEINNLPFPEITNREQKKIIEPVQTLLDRGNTISSQERDKLTNYIDSKVYKLYEIAQETYISTQE